MELTTPGEVLNIFRASDAAPLPPPSWRLPAPWYAVSLKDGDLILQAVQSTRRPDWNVVVENTGPPSEDSEADQERKQPRHALALPDSALVGFRLTERPGDMTYALALRPGNYPSALRLPVTLHDRWQATVQVNGQTWHLYTESTRRKDGALLAGSLSLVAKLDSGEKQVLIPPTEGAAFERQELLWLGSTRAPTGRASIDLLLKRTWLTGKVEYVLRVANVLGSTILDPDHPYEAFESGVGAYATTKSYVQQLRPAPPEKFGTAAFTIHETEWDPAVDAAQKEGLPKLLFDRQLNLDEEKLRVTIEYLPRMRSPDGAETMPAADHWSGPVLIKVHFRGKTQVLLETWPSSDGDFTLQAGKLHDEPAIQISAQPHYNNSFLYDWAWDATQQRFVRLYKKQLQGC